MTYPLCGAVLPAVLLVPVSASPQGPSDPAKRTVVWRWAAGKAKASVQAAGAAASLPLGALVPPVTVQLVDHESAGCFEGRFAADAVTTHDATTFKAKTLR